MTCEICGKDWSGPIVVLLIRRLDGRISTFACPPCAEDSPAYCRAHSSPRIGFADDTTACPRCIEEEVTRQEGRASEIWQRLIYALPASHVSALIHWAGTAHALTGHSVEVCLLRAVITRAQRTHTSIGQAVDDVVVSKSVAAILPPEFVPESS